MVKVSFVVPTYHRPGALRVTLKALARVDFPPDSYEIIVVDNADDAASAAVVSDLEPGGVEVTYVVERKAGSAATRNRGAAVASGELLIFCDDDIIVEPDHVELHLRAQTRFHRAVVTGTWEYAPGTLYELNKTAFGRYRLALDRRFREEVDQLPLDDGCLEVEALSAANLAIARQLFWALGGFDEDFPFAGAEDREFSMRAAKAGCLLVRSERIRTLHNEQWLTFRQFCTREERSAQTVAVLARKYPDAERGVDFAAVNGPSDAQDSLVTRMKKGVKSILGLPPVLTVVHALIRGAEKAGLEHRVMARLYTGVVGVHILRGFRSVG